MSDKKWRITRRMRVTVDTQGRSAGIEELSSRAVDGRQMSIEELYGSRLYDDEITRSYVMSGSGIALFEKAVGDELHVEALSLHKFACSPVLCNMPLTKEPQRSGRIFEHFPMIDMLAQKQDYVWDTPSFRQVCREYGIDPDYQRPVFPEECSELAYKLIEWDVSEAMRAIGYREMFVKDVLRWIEGGLDRSSHLHGKIKSQWHKARLLIPERLLEPLRRLVFKEPRLVQGKIAGISLVRN